MISAKGKKDPECVKVVVRCRPMSRREVEDTRQQIVSINIDTGEVSVRNPESDIKEAPKPFTFDQVFDSNCEQEHVFQTTAQPIVDSVLQGYNGTVFAYGQTGTGKTHTMEGLWDPPEQRGIIPRSFARIFSEIDDTHDQNFLVRASFLEIYNEEVRDLLAKDPKNKLDLKEDNDRGVYVKDLTSYVVKGATEMENVLLAGKKNRSVGATLMNQDSSRSHSIFTIVIESSAEGSDGSRHIRAGKLNLVDLAGSERQSKTGATGDRLKEATKINLSLSALGNVISALVDSKSHHIPYRDSKLTRLLQDSLGGNTKTVMVANIGPADYNYDETISTLRYANRAKNIKNKPKINEDPKDTMLREFQEEIARLKSMLESQQNDPEVRGVQGRPDPAPQFTGQEMVKQMSNKQLENIHHELEEQKLALQAVREPREKSRRNETLDDVRPKIFAKRKETERKKRSARRSVPTDMSKLQAMQEKVVVGSANAEEARRREEELARAQMELERRREEQQRLSEQLREQVGETLAMEEKYASIQEEVQAKTKKLKKIWTRYEQARAEAEDLRRENQIEREDLLQTIRESDQSIKLLSLIVQNFIPDEERMRIESLCEWSPDDDPGTF
ncbi:hypothetical protein GUITHDRAFT_73421 [Guillardia theta CCMP2712]|uniref:Kinesin-like protein n=1 Tax=Guillardia theta (strain CCMP2712) TaxID=905079 RepID=L1J510_GUITC|nr:hypothetical protein GUITHDRAFT_73421 [Guillardia theta CCMP2712]EKX43204.1 hypothetical protein GUITHDRAFT_73421 [Guillardia theta CCMP2712]|eukprot:XP_005830184.1 hypothetical protein GUITHDRAFT_73421 [Guillardia theta CCMP2712]